MYRGRAHVRPETNPPTHSQVAPHAADKSRTRDLLFVAHPLNAVTLLFPQLPYLVAWSQYCRLSLLSMPCASPFENGRMSKLHAARSCRVTCVLPLPAQLATSHELVAGSRRGPSRPGPHPGARRRLRRLLVSSPRPAVPRFWRPPHLPPRASS